MMLRNSIALFLTLTAAFAVTGPARATDPILDLNAIDPTVDPCQDFYHFACGGWLKSFQLPADRPSYNRQSDGLAVASEGGLNSILKGYAAGDFSIPAKYAQSLGMYYASCINTPRIASETPGFIADHFGAIDAVQNSKDLAKLVASLQLEGLNLFFSFGSTQDLDDSSQVIGQLDQGGMSFADRGYYFNTDPKSVEILQRFIGHATKIFQAAGESSANAQQDAQLILSFETSLARNALATEDMQDATQLHHPMDLAGVRQLAPHFDWDSFFQGLGLSATGKINVTHPEFFAGFDTILTSTPLLTLKIYLKWQVLHRYASSLSEPFRNEDFDFWSHYLAGQAKQKELWKSCTGATGGAMRDALAEAYVNGFSDPAAIRAHAEAMILQIKAAFGQNLNNLDWLDDATRQAAQGKLAKVKDKVGYPDHWMNIDTLASQLNRDSYLSNVSAASGFASRTDLNKIGKPVDRSLWDMPPWEINAYYNPPSNEMVFPIGALVPPIFDLTASQGENFGSIGGGWMGHELTHGFDSDGSNFDADGNLVDWWTKATRAEFNNRTQCLVDQASRYEVLPGLFVKGKQTLTENLADQGGVKMGYLAFRTATAGQNPAPNVGQFNERQQYWVAYAQSWCTQQTDEKVRLTVTTDVHPPAEFRTNAVLFNRPEFAEDFGCKPGSQMAPMQRCSVW